MEANDSWWNVSLWFNHSKTTSTKQRKCERLWKVWVDFYMPIYSNLKLRLSCCFLTDQMLLGEKSELWKAIIGFVAIDLPSMLFKIKEEAKENKIHLLTIKIPYYAYPVSLTKRRKLKLAEEEKSTSKRAKIRGSPYLKDCYFIVPTETNTEKHEKYEWCRDTGHAD